MASLNPNPKRKLRVGGQVVEAGEEELRNLTKDAGQPAPPTTPAGAAALGASPDAVKMAGSRQQTEAAPTAIAVSGKDNLQTAQRTQQARTEATEAEQGQAAKAGKLGQLQDLDERTQALVNAQLAGLQTTAPQVQYNDATFGTLGADVDQAALKTLLGTWQQAVQSGDQQAALQAQAQLQNQYAITNPQDYISLDKSRVATDVAQQVLNPDQVTLGAMDLSPLGLSDTDLTSLLGPDYKDLTVPQFQQRLNDVRQAEFQRINGLRAQLATAPVGSAQRELLLRELGDLASVGVTGVEQGVRQLQDQLDRADVVKVGGVERSVEELLKDDSISRIVADYLNPAGDPESKAALEADQPELVAWIKSNAEALETLARDMGVANEDFKKVQEAQSQLAEVAEGVSLSDEVMKALGVDLSQSTGAVGDLSGNNLYSVLTGANADPATVSGITNKLNADPSWVEKLKDLPPADIEAAHKFAEYLDDPLIAGLVDTDESGFILDSGTRLKIQNAKKIIDLLRDDPAAQAMLNDDEFARMVKDGTITLSKARELKDKPQAWTDWKEYQGFLKQLSDIENDKTNNRDNLLGFLFGNAAYNADYVSKLHGDLKQTVAWDPYNKDAKRRLAELEALVGPDGKISGKEYSSLLERVKAGLSGGTLKDALAGKTNVLDFKLRDQLAGAVGVGKGARDEKSQTFFTKVEEFLKGDGRITADELVKLSPAEYDKFMSAPAAWRKQVGLPSQKQVDQYREQLEWNAAFKDISAVYTSVKLHPHKISNLIKAPNGTEDTINALDSVRSQLLSRLHKATGGAKRALREALDQVKQAISANVVEQRTRQARASEGAINAIIDKYRNQALGPGGPALVKKAREGSISPEEFERELKRLRPF